METRLETITPEKALSLLKNNTKNRSLNKDLVLFYADQMLKNQWKITGQGISISDNNILIDGQHRLAAIVKSNIAQIMNVTYGLLYEDVYSVYDTGKSRNAKDVLYVNNVKHASHISSSVRLKKSLDIGERLNGQLKFSNTEISNEYFDNKGIYDMYVKKALLYKNKLQILSVSNICGVCAHLEIKKSNDTNKILGFFNELYGLSDETNDVVSILRSILINNLAQRDRMIIDNKLKYISKAWNAYVTGNTYKRLIIINVNKPIFL